ncbi:MAG TPA: hypothetical protein VIH90_00730, partial [Candidatus Saccharimonadales bacterium]
LTQKSHGWFSHAYTELSSQINFFNIVFMFLLVVSSIYWWKRRKSFSIYCLMFLAIPLIGHQFGGFNRYVLMAFPLQFMIYDKFKKNPAILTLILCVSTVLWTFTALQFMGGYTGS